MFRSSAQPTPKKVDSNPVGLWIIEEQKNLSRKTPLANISKFENEPQGQFYAAHTYREFDDQQQDITPQEESQKTSNDYIVSGYNAFGLPFQLIASDFESKTNDGRKKCFQYIRDHILKKIDGWANDLAHSDDPYQLCNDCIKDIFHVLQQHKFPHSFSLAISICYQKFNPSTQEEELRCAGFGIGGNGILLHDGIRTEQLVSPTRINDRAVDTFGQVSCEEKGVMRVLMRHQPFDVAVQEKNEIVIHSDLFPDLYETAHTQRTVTDKVEKFSLKRNLKQENSLFDTLKSANDLAFTTHLRNKKGIFGSDSTLSSITVPDQITQLKIQKNILNQEKNRFQKQTRNHPNAQKLIDEGKKAAMDSKHRKCPRVQSQIIRHFTAASEIVDAKNNFHSKLNQPIERNDDAIGQAYEKYMKKLKHIEKITSEKNSSLILKAFGVAVMAFGVGLFMLSTLALLMSVGLFTFGPLGFFPGIFGIKASAVCMTLPTAVFAQGLLLFRHDSDKPRPIVPAFPKLKLA